MRINQIIRKTPITRGWTPDQKYRAETNGGHLYFLRICSQNRADRLRRAFHLQKKAATLGLPVATPLEMGDLAESFYTLETWVDGIDARNVIQNRTKEQLYADGLSAGRTLRVIHSIPLQSNPSDWEIQYNHKIQRKIEEYRACPLRYENDKPLFSGIEENQELLKGRPQCYQHGDYHAGNFMYVQDRITVVDFDRCDIGDPWEEFKKLPWCVDASPALARGMVDGYFWGPPPEEFWRLLKLYLCCGMFSNLPWAIPYGEQEIRVMYAQAKRVTAWYESGIIPHWYNSDNKE